MCIRSAVMQMRKHKYFLNHENIANYQAKNWSMFPILIPKILTFCMTFLMRACAQHNGILWGVRN